jgi:hypothetical protein
MGVKGVGGRKKGKERGIRIRERHLNIGVGIQYRDQALLVF